MGIRKRLLLLLLSIAVPLSGIGVYALLSVRAASLEQQNDSVKQQVELAAVIFERWVEAQQQTVATLAAMVDAKPDSTQDVANFLRAAMTTRRQWIDVRVVNEHGKSLVAYPADIPLPPALIDYLISETHRLQSWKVLTDRVQDHSQPVFAIAAPLKKGGAVIVRISGEAVNELFREIELSPSAVIVVFDEKYRLLYRRETNSEPVDPNITATSLLSAVDKSHSTVIEQESPFDGIRRVYGMAYLEATNNVVVVGIPSAVLHEPARRQLVRYVIFSGLAMFIGLLAAWLLGRSIVLPIRALHEATKSLGEGNLAARAPWAGGEIGEMGEAFNAMAQQVAEREENLRELDRLKSEFVSGVSHELRTPLTTIKTLAHVLQTGKATPAEQQEYLVTITAECDRQIDLILNLLDLARIEAGHFAVQLAEANLSEVLAECLKLEKHSAAEREQSLALSLLEDLPPTQIDKNALRRVICSLLENAIKYTPVGGAIILSAQASDQEIAITVTDTGCGVWPDDLPLIFDKFYRGRPAINEFESEDRDEDVVAPVNDAPGVGLGLYLSRSIMRKLGGDISAVNNPAGGTVFTVHLPVSPKRN